MKHERIMEVFETKETLRRQFSSTLTKEKYLAIKEMNDVYKINETILFDFGIKYCYSIQKDIDARVLLNDYVPCFFRNVKKTPISIFVKPLKKTIPIKLYHLEYISLKKVMMFYKEMDDTNDMPVRTQKIMSKSIHKDIVNQFIIDTNLIPIK